MNQLGAKQRSNNYKGRKQGQEMRIVSTKAELLDWAQSLPDDAKIVADDAMMLVGGGIVVGVDTPDGIDQDVEIPCYVYVEDGQ